MDFQGMFHAVIAALGSSITTLVLFLKYGTNKIVDMLLSKYQLSLDKKLETYKAEIEAKNYVTKFRFDKEFEVLHKLTQDYYDFTFLAWNVYINISINSNSEFDECYKNFTTACDNYTLYFFKNCAIINKELANSFRIGIENINEFRKTAKYCRNSFLTYNNLNKTDTDGYQTHVIQNMDKLKVIHDELNVGKQYGFQHMIDLVRDYLNSLQII